ncbi:MAG: hypothetical protein H5U22_00215 [Rhizobium sp.]|nr:hypothetical protein [Rhizobium sp.]
MGTAVARVTLTTVMAAFFAGLALDIAVPAVVLTVMAGSNWLVQVWPESRGRAQPQPQRWKGRPA